jgi:hypothetical protein
MAFLNKQVVEPEDKTPSWLDRKEPEKIKGELPQFPLDVGKLRNAERFVLLQNFLPFFRSVCLVKRYIYPGPRYIVSFAGSYGTMSGGQKHSRVWVNSFC